ncbi:DNA-binding protein [Thermoanaerobacterium sp. PSU-2]|uniref:excisionase family DNA-binding protein n=1 Tax=Thermoanaerobacterium sp. PSU-2 TaxID=1930849 RepID=UPI000A15713E|nr:excisionase family DNA-binding protein [Thermoanaerobacterium sp. PSU-2]ORX23374.1 DNA-binding protein [Thermoanaerobacterium sp. PSU-2]HHV74884.1 excisionase family DNA-binding protein [Thermoanaerobacterium sp.]
MDLEQQEVIQVTMTANEAAQYIGISYWKLLDMVKKHEVPYIACGSRKLFRKEALDRWMEEQEKKALEKPIQRGIRKIY